MAEYLFSLGEALGPIPSSVRKRQTSTTAWFKPLSWYLQGRKGLSFEQVRQNGKDRGALYIDVG